MFTKKKQQTLIQTKDKHNSGQGLQDKNYTNGLVRSANGMV